MLNRLFLEDMWFYNYLIAYNHNLLNDEACKLKEVDRNLNSAWNILQLGLEKLKDMALADH
jgi:hypothetical protein